MLTFKEFKQKLDYLPQKELEYCWNAFNWGFAQALHEIRMKYCVELCNNKCENCSCPITLIDELDKKQNAELNKMSKENNNAETEKN